MKNKYLLTFSFILLTIIGYAQFPIGGYQGGGFGSGGDKTLDVVVVNLKAYLQGAWDTTNHTTTLNDLGLLPLEQPYDTIQVGYYQYAGNEHVAMIPHDSITDWILVELRETIGSAADADHDSIITKRAGFILSNGTITDLDGKSKLRFKYASVSKDLFLVVKHRNHLPVISAVNVPVVDEVYSYDFTDAAGKAYHSGAANDPMANLGSGNHGLWAGEVGSVGFTQNIDYYNSMNPAWSDQGHIYFIIMNQKQSQVIPGYYIEDVNMNGVVRYTGKENDRLMIWRNTSTGPYNYGDVWSHVPY